MTHDEWLARARASFPASTPEQVEATRRLSVAHAKRARTPETRPVCALPRAA